MVVLGDQSAILTGGTVGEGIDGARCRLPGRQRDPVEAVAATGTPVVAVLTNGRPFVLDWMVERVSAIVEAGFPGPGGGEAVADVIFGAVNPSGKLPVSLPRDAGVLPARFDRAQPE